MLMVGLVKKFSNTAISIQVLDTSRKGSETT